MNIDIKKLRQDIGATQLQFAKMIGVSRGALVEWEAGTITPSQSKMERIIFINKYKERIFVKNSKSKKTMKINNIPLEIIEKWLAYDDCDVRVVAMNAAANLKDCPIEIIEKGLADDDCDVRVAAMEACQEDIPLGIVEILVSSEKDKVVEDMNNNIVRRIKNEY